MPNCPDDIDLLRLFEGKCSGEEAAKLWKHVEQCASCKSALEDLAESDFQQREGALQPLEESARSSAAKKIATLSITKRQPNKEVAATSEGVKGVLGLGMGLGAMLRDIARGLEGHAVPALGAGNSENHDDGVRNFDPGDSVSGEDSKQYLHAKGEFHMNNEFVEPSKVEGTPPDATPDEILQHQNDTCAIRSQEIVLRDFGVNVSEEQLRNEAMEHGWYAPGGGTPVNAVGNLLELHGVEVNRYENANIFNLQNELAQGHRVIVGVDSGELWHSGFLEKAEDVLGISGADHALVVSSIDTTDPDHVKVVLTDPGSGQVAAVYSQEQFQDAWKDSNCMMISTTEPAPHYASGMENFDYAQGHVSHVGQMPYDLFSHYMDYMATSTDLEQMQRITDIYNSAIQDYNGLLLELGMPGNDPSMAGSLGYYDDLAIRIDEYASNEPIHGVPWSDTPHDPSQGGIAGMHNNDAGSEYHDPSLWDMPDSGHMDDGDNDFDHNV